MKNFLKKLAELAKKSCKAETLLEVIVATTVLMTVIVPASSLYISNIKSSAVNKNDLIGASLAEEGLEMMKNIRDTNLLKFSANADSNGNNICWATRPDPLLTIDNCDENQIGAGSYKIDIKTSDPQLPIQLFELFAPPGPALNPESLTNTFALKLDELNEAPISKSPCGKFDTPMENCHNHFQHDTHLYVHATNPPFSPFYRELKVDRMLNLDANAATNEGMQITATVVYMSGSKPRIIKRTMILTNRAPSL